MNTTRTAARDGIYIGLISGTSADGVDVAVVEFSGKRMTTLATTTYPYAAETRAQLLALIAPGRTATLHEIATLDVRVAHHFAGATNMALQNLGLAPTSVTAIGSHGQTIQHCPSGTYPYSWQIGSGAVIAARTGITTVADFRSLDVALGGEGAPLVPPFHHWFFSDPARPRVVVNIGGIANISVLHGDGRNAFLGFDTGPGNCLLDEWCQKHRNEPFDRDGTWAASASPSPRLLTRLLGDPYYTMPAPKSTGREKYHLNYLAQAIEASNCEELSPDVVQSTIMELTVTTIVDAITVSSGHDESEIYVCGGGALNGELMRRLAAALPTHRVTDTGTLGLDPEYVEASAFAWLARQRLSGEAVTLSTHLPPRSLPLGAVHCAPVALGD